MRIGPGALEGHDQTLGVRPLLPSKINTSNRRFSTTIGSNCLVVSLHSFLLRYASSF